jgi:hypothetical protein
VQEAAHTFEQSNAAAQAAEKQVMAQAQHRFAKLADRACDSLIPTLWFDSNL